eukprot:COSAG03_NODE_6455_length_1057_cov_4.860125_2_plen_190_part_00
MRYQGYKYNNSYYIYTPGATQASPCCVRCGPPVNSSIQAVGPRPPPNLRCLPQRGSFAVCSPASVATRPALRSASGSAHSIVGSWSPGVSAICRRALLATACQPVVGGNGGTVRWRCPDESAGWRDGTRCRRSALSEASVATHSYTASYTAIMPRTPTRISHQRLCRLRLDRPPKFSTTSAAFGSAAFT